MRRMAQAHGAIGMIQNWGNLHWVAYRWGRDGNIYLLDSMQLGPVRVSEQDFVASLTRHATYAVGQREDH
jgi:hypothetical protein